jgi:hypothetical protein
VDANHHIKLQDSDKLDIIQSSGATTDEVSDYFFEQKKDTGVQEVGYPMNEKIEIRDDIDEETCKLYQICVYNI